MISARDRLQLFACHLAEIGKMVRVLLCCVLYTITATRRGRAPATAHGAEGVRDDGKKRGGEERKRRREGGREERGRSYRTGVRGKGRPETTKKSKQCHLYMRENE